MANQDKPTEVDGKALAQRAGLALALGAAFYMFSTAMAPGAGGTFSSQSKPTKHSAFAAEGDAEDGWGNGSGSARSGRISDEQRARAAAARARNADPEGSASGENIPVYDPGKDGGWGSN